MDLRIAGGLIGGALLGYAYHRVSVALTGGGCPLLCSPWRAMAFGGVVGLLLATSGGRPPQRDLSNVLGAKEQTMSKVAVADGVPVHVTEDSFAALVKGSDKPILLDAYADWCGPCRMLAPQLEAVAKELSGRVTVAKLDVDASPQVASALGVRSIPALFVIDKGKVIDAWGGFQPAADIVGRLKTKLPQLG